MNLYNQYFFLYINAKSANDTDDDNDIDGEDDDDQDDDNDKKVTFLSGHSSEELT